MKRKILFSVILLISILSCYGQSWQQLDSLTEQYIEIQNFDTALIYSELALETVEESYGIDDTLYANLLARNSLVHYFLGNYNEAINILLQEKEIRENKQNKFHFGYGRLLNDLGVMYEITGKYKEAEFYYISCLKITEETIGENHSDYAILCSNIAVFYHITGSFQQAEQYHLLALDIQKNTIGDQHPDYATTLNNLGYFYSESGNYKKAEQYHLEALIIRKKVFGEKHTEYTQSLTNLASLYANLGNYSKAEKLFLQIIQIEKEIYGKTHPDITIRLNSLGIIYSEMGNYTKAIQYQSESLKIDEENFGKKHRNYAIDLNNLAGIYYDLGKFEKAEPLYVESLNIIGEIFGKNHPDYSLRLYNLSNVYLKTGNYERSEILALEALQIRDSIFGKKHPDFIKSQIQLASLYFAMDDYEKAEPFVLKSMNQTSMNIFQNFSFLSDEEKEQYLKTVSKRFDFFNSYALRRKKNNPEIAGYTFNNNMRNKALLLKSSTVMRQSILSGNDSALLNKYQELIDLRKQLSKLYSMPKNEQYMSIEELEGQANTIEKELVRGSQLFDEYKRVQEYTWESIRDKLKKNEAAVDIIRFRYYSQNAKDSILYAALIVTGETKNHPLLIVLKNSPEFERKYIMEYNNYIQIEFFDEGFPKIELGYHCYQAFWEEIENEIEDKKVVYFCPDGIYHKINLNTIICPDEKYLFEKKELIILNSLSELLEDKEPQGKRIGRALLVGNPDFSINKKSNIQFATNVSAFVSDTIERSLFRDYMGDELKKLPGSQLEVEQIDSLLKRYNWETQCLTGNQAIEEAVKKANSPQILHIATHGFFASDVYIDNLPERSNSLLFGQNMEKTTRFPLLRSGLMFCGSQNAINGKYDPLENYEDGILTGYEVVNLDLSTTELVVLSACETGLGEIMNGEGVYGLQRAFKIAGAQNIIMSLWKVDDEATQLLMKKFYEFWLADNSKREAFTLAQNYLRTQTIYNQPYFWGGFVFVGLEAPIKKSNFNYLWILMVFIPFGILLYCRRKNRKPSSIKNI